MNRFRANGVAVSLGSELVAGVACTGAELRSVWTRPGRRLCEELCTEQSRARRSESNFLGHSTDNADLKIELA